MSNISISEELLSLGAKLSMDEPMKLHTSFRIGGAADIWCEARDIKILSDVIKTCKARGIPYFVIGQGTNLLVSDKGIRGVVIKLCGDFDEIEALGENRIRCGAGL